MPRDRGVTRRRRRLHTSLTHEFIEEGQFTFELSGCCTPEKLAFTDGDEVLTAVDIPLENCGYDDLSVADIQFCCDTVSLDLKGVECDVTSTLVLENEAYRKEIATTVSDDGPVRFTWTGCYTPASASSCGGTTTDSRRDVTRRRVRAP